MQFPIVTICSCSDKAIGDCFKGILNETGVAIEMIAIDCINTYHLVQIVKENSHGVSMLASEMDNEIKEPLKMDLSFTKGLVIGMFHSDDFYDCNNMLHWPQQAFEHNTHAGGAYNNLVYVDYHEKSKTASTWISGSYNPRKFYYAWMHPDSIVFFRNQGCRFIGQFNLFLRSVCDYKCILRYFLNFVKKVHYLLAIMVHIRARGIINNSIRNLFNAHANDNKVWQLKILTPLFKTTPL